MGLGYDIGEVFRKAWEASYRKEGGNLDNQMVPGLEIRRLATAFSGSTMWEYMDDNPTEDQLFLLGLDIARFHFPGDGMGPPFSLYMSRYDKADIIELGRIAHNAVRGPEHPVIKALFRRFGT
jgi:hypothetical protein